MSWTARRAFDGIPMRDLMQVPQTTSRSIALTLALAMLVLCTTLVTSVASAAATTGVDAAVAVTPGAKATGVKALCTREAKRKTRRLNASASASTAATRKAQHAKAILQRRCMARLRRAAKKQRPVTPTTSTPHPGPLAIGIDGGYSDWWSEEVKARTALGAAVTRHEWDPSSEAVDAQDSLVLTAASEVHTKIHALLGGNELGDPTHYREWVVAFIRRYGQGGSFWSEHPSLDAGRYAITTFELGNEPYFGGMSAGDYADTVRPTLEAVKQLGLPAKLILPSYIYDKDTHWIDTLYQRIPNLNELFYAFADHPYWYGHSPSDSGGNSPFERLDTLRRKMSEHGAGDKPIFITEYGESTANCGSECVSESAQADHIREMIEAVVSHPDWGVELLCLYQLHDWSTNSSGREQQFGLLQEDGTPKPAYSVALAAMQQFRG
jgi:hypothetical protein